MLALFQTIVIWIYELHLSFLIAQIIALYLTQ